MNIRDDNKSKSGMGLYGTYKTDNKTDNENAAKNSPNFGQKTNENACSGKVLDNGAAHATNGARSNIASYIFNTKRKLRFWRVMAIVLLVASAILLFGKGRNDHFINDSLKGNISENHIAEIEIKEVLLDEKRAVDTLDEIKNNKNAKAVMITIDSPGGSASVSEILYKKIREVAKVKPVTAKMVNVAASGGYIVALGADYIVANETTITGSVGVIMQNFQIDELLKKIGVNASSYKSSHLKAEPSPFSKPDKKIDSYINGLIAEAFDWFKKLVISRRNLKDKNDIDFITNGGVFSGSTAVRVGAIDAIGGNEEIIKWLEKNHDVKDTTPIVKYDSESSVDKLRKIFGKNNITDALFGKTFRSGLLAIWHQ